MTEQQPGAWDGPVWTWGAGSFAGLMIGVAVGVSLGNIGMGIAIGIALGAAFGITFSEAAKSRRRDPRPPGDTGTGEGGAENDVTPRPGR